MHLLLWACEGNVKQAQGLIPQKVDLKACNTRIISYDHPNGRFIIASIPTVQVVTLPFAALQLLYNVQKVINFGGVLQLWGSGLISYCLPVCLLACKQTHQWAPAAKSGL